MSTWRPRPRLAGSTDVVDRDLQRIENDLAALEQRSYPTTRSKAVRWFRTRLAPGRRSPA
jgi:hypothetical protein